MHVTDSQATLEGRTALVFGAGKGLGRAIAIGLAEAGADVFAVARTRDDLQALEHDIRACRRRCAWLAGDATRSSDVDRAMADAVRLLGGVDVLVNAVGGNLRKKIVDITDDEWDGTIRANLTSAFYACRAAGRHFLERKAGSVINVASTAGMRGRPNASAYSASKAALINFSRALAMEWAPAGVRVNVLSPGRFLTPATQDEMGDPDRYAAYIRNVPLRRIGQPGELKPVAVWLASDASSFVTGSVVVIDGGQTLL
jgi:2-deoxy-D-gluconate 3-dehydrogenase